MTTQNRFCRKCGATLVDPSDAFCSFCGYPLNASGSPASLPISKDGPAPAADDPTLRERIVNYEVKEKINLHVPPECWTIVSERIDRPIGRDAWLDLLGLMTTTKGLFPKESDEAHISSIRLWNERFPSPVSLESQQSNRERDEFGLATAMTTRSFHESGEADRHLQLGQNETILYRTRLSGCGVFGQPLWWGVGVVLWLATDLFPGWLVDWFPGGSLPLALVVGLATAGYSANQAAKWATTRIVLTSDRIIWNSGLYTKQSLSVPLSRVESVQVKVNRRSLINRGEVSVTGIGNSHWVFENVDDPESLEEEILDALIDMD